MKLIFNDATEIVVQQVESHGDYLRILTVGNTPEQLKVLFTDSSRTARMIVQERGQTVAAYEGYTAFYRTEARLIDMGGKVRLLLLPWVAQLVTFRDVNVLQENYIAKLKGCRKAVV